MSTDPRKMSAPPSAIQRRSFLRLTLASVAGATLAGSLSARDAARGPRPDRHGRNRILLAYFSRPGENYWNGGRKALEVGNTEVPARLISATLDCDVHRIRERDPYPDDHEATVARNVREQDADARPAIANRLRSIDRYDTILLASPIWNVRPPMIMSTCGSVGRLNRFERAGFLDIMRGLQR